MNRIKLNHYKQRGIAITVMIALIATLLPCGLGNSIIVNATETSVTSQKELVEALNKNEKVKLDADIIVDNTIEVTSGSVEFDLNGKKLSCSNTSVPTIKVKGTAVLSIDDSSAAKTGTITSEKDIMEIYDGGQLVLNNGNIKLKGENSSAIVLKKGAVIINDGYFQIENPNEFQRFITLRGEAGSIVTINDGEFYMHNNKANSCCIYMDNGNRANLLINKALFRSDDVRQQIVKDTANLGTCRAAYDSDIYCKNEADTLQKKPYYELEATCKSLAVYVPMSIEKIDDVSLFLGGEAKTLSIVAKGVNPRYLTYEWYLNRQVRNTIAKEVRDGINYNLSSTGSVLTVNNVSNVDGLVEPVQCKVTDTRYENYVASWASNKCSNTVELRTSITPDTLTGLSVSKGASILTYSWDKCDGASSYNIVCVDSNNKTVYAKDNYEGTSVIIGNLQQGSAYTFMIEPVCEYDGKQYIGKSESLTAVTNKIDGIVGLKVIARTDTSSSITWAAQSANVRYNIDRYSSDGSKLLQSYDTNTNVLNVTGLPNGSVYLYKVTAYVIENGQRIYGSSSMIEAATRPVAIINLKVASKGTTSNYLSWTTKASNVKYKVERYNTSGKLLKRYYTSSKNINITGLSSGTEYTYKVTPYVSEDGLKIFGSTISTIVTCTLPLKATVTGLTTSSKHTVKATWKKITCTGYQVKIATNSTFTKNAKTYYVTGSTKTIANLTKNKKYYVRVRAYKTVKNTKIYGNWSTTKSIKCK